MKLFLSFTIFLLCLLFNHVFSMNFNFTIEKVTLRCLAEYLTHSTLVVIRIESDSKDIRVRLFDPNGNALINKEKRDSIKISYTATDSGNYQICIDNYGAKEANINFEFLSGIAAKDYSQIVKKHSLKPIELNLQKLEDMMKQLINEFSIINSIKQKQLSINDLISSRVMFFSIGLVICMFCVSCLEVIHIKKFFKLRKII